MVPLKLLQHSLLRPLDFPCQKWLHYSVLIHRWCYPTTAFAVLIYALRYIRVYSNAFSKIMVYCFWYKCHSINWKTNWVGHPPPHPTRTIAWYWRSCFVYMCLTINKSKWHLVLKISQNELTIKKKKGFFLSN